MSARDAAFLRTVTFGDLGAGVWGAAWGAEQPLVALGLVDGAEAGLADGSLEGSGEHEPWRIVSELTELAVAPEGGAVPVAAGQGFDQLCRVRGEFAGHGDGRAVDCLGRRSFRVQFPDFARFASLRDVSAWFEPGEGISLVSLRPRKASGHSDDLITAAVFEPGTTEAVANPRLSTTYTVGGVPSRLTLELWLDDDEQGSARYPRRAAGEATGQRASAQRGRLDFHAELLRCQSHGREGAGVYLLVRAA